MYDWIKLHHLHMEVLILVLLNNSYSFMLSQVKQAANSAISHIYNISFVRILM